MIVAVAVMVVAVIGVVATVWCVRTDGYRRVPTR